MKKTELKKILKPLIKECIKEVIFEDGVLSSLISEVARGMHTTQTVPSLQTAETKVDPTLERMKRNAFSTQQSDKLKKHKTKLMEAIGGAAYNGMNLFEGTTPVPAQASPSQQAGPLSRQAPEDAGVDISNLLGAVGGNWNAHMNDVKEGK